MIRIIVPNEDVKQQMIEQSRFVHDLDIDTDKCNTLAHLYMLPDEAWIIGERETPGTEIRVGNNDRFSMCVPGKKIFVDENDETCINDEREKTGFFDINGTEIRVGDYLEGIEYPVYKRDDGVFCCMIRYDFHEIELNNEFKGKVVGNIIDNPELDYDD